MALAGPAEVGTMPPPGREQLVDAKFPVERIL